MACMPGDGVDMELRKAARQDMEHVVDCVWAMLQEMALHGGHALNQEDRVRSRLRARFTNSLDREDHVYIIAVSGPEASPVAGIVEASVVAPDEFFQPQPVLHVHSLYVQPDCRGQGLGGTLLRAGLEWGKGRGCLQAKLNVLVGNPARKLYEKLGFEAFELAMRLGL
jgi:ribosomal protein S18 acetylase RimI-like enzyme